MKLSKFGATLSLAAALPACAHADAQTTAMADASAIGHLPTPSAAAVQDFRSQVDALYRMKEKAFADEDADKIVEHFYAADAVAFGPEGKPTMGRDALRAEYKEVVKIANVKVEPIRAHIGTDAAWEWVNFRAVPKDPSHKPFTFIMLFVFANKNGQWVSGGDAYTIGEFPAAL